MKVNGDCGAALLTANQLVPGTNTKSSARSSAQKSALSGAQGGTRPATPSRPASDSNTAARPGNPFIVRLRCRAALRA